MSKSHGTNTSTRRRLFRANPHCHWCDNLTLLLTVGEARRTRQLNRMATIDHVRCKAESESREAYNALANKVLSCYGCNARRNREFLDSAKLRGLDPSGKGRWEKSSRRSGHDHHPGLVRVGHSRLFC